MTKCLFALALIPAVILAQAPHRSGSVHTPEVDLGYEVLGAPSAEIPLFAVNGGPGLSHAYMMQNDLWQRVAAHRLVVVYDQRGTGASKHVRPNAPQTMDAQVADLEAIRKALALDRIAVLGDSYGGMIAMAYAAAHPEHVSRLILSDSPAPAWKNMVHLLPQVFPDREEQDEAEGKQLAADPEAAAQAGLVNHMRMCFYSPEKRDAYVSHMGDLGFVPAVGQAVQKATENLDLTPSLAGFHFPTLVITGRYDMNVAPLTAWRVAHAIPGAQIVFFEKSGHLPAYEEPEKYLQVLESFLATDRAKMPKDGTAKD
ncbi:MAG TPA: alpha/beta hydrolase [Steroidobacteraceae bacterium]|jgi:proline iminopeptidase|nr:alpha/beta hydrolase [Steroidobacteraceae bacterium]